AHEIAVEIFFAGECAVPWGRATGTIGKRAAHVNAFRVFRRAHARMPGGGAAHGHVGGEGRQAAVIGAADHRLPAVADVLDFHHAVALRCHFRFHLVAGGTHGDVFA